MNNSKRDPNQSADGNHDEPGPRQRRPIGVFDSGIGGLTVAAALRQLLPSERIFYIGDTARVPYGGKSAQTIERYSFEISNMLLKEGAKIIVVACNTASALAVPALQRALEIPVVGVIAPGAAAAVAQTRNGRVGVIGTRATIGSQAYERAIHAINPEVEVLVQACPLLVPLIEEGWLDDPVTAQVIRRYLQPILAQNIDTLVLGCTHYPLLKRALEGEAGHAVTLVDSAQNCALEVRSILAALGLGAPETENGGLQVALTDPPVDFLKVAEDSLQLQVGEIQLRHLG
ncbi:MAG: glutamate racemase [Verrucomicrobia bacterium]|nr:glutamate racemase [Verrucomicrobiota bacterium]